MNATQTPPCISIGIRAWNEEGIIRQTLKSLFNQSIFGELYQRGEQCEVVCIPNGCTARTAAVAREVFVEQERWHPFAPAFRCRVVEVKQAGRNNTWNSYVHSYSDPNAEL